MGVWYDRVEGYIMKKVVDNPRLHSNNSENIHYHPSPMGPDGCIFEPARIG